MIKNDIVIEGVQTNNLKNIRIAIKKNAINLIIGPSGSGKSSLAYDTIAQIGQHEFQALFNEDTPEPKYSIKSYSNMIATVPIRQTNNNHNDRSTISTYFGLSSSIAFIYSALLKVPESLFTLTNRDNVCPACYGLGLTSKLDEFRIISPHMPLSQNPIRCWNKYKDFYRQILVSYCMDCGIDPMQTFSQLTASAKETVLYGTSTKKYTIKYKKGGRIASRTTPFYGIFTGHSMIPGFSPGKQFFSECVCQVCNGKKYATSHDQYSIEGLSIGDFMATPFERVFPIVNSLIEHNSDPHINLALKKIRTFLVTTLDLNLGHLCFHRSIPSLSGGELQRLKLVQVFTSQLSDLLIILDEPLAGLSGNEAQAVFHNILRLAKQHTLLIVDHGNQFVPFADTITALGPGSGRDGGSLIDFKKYLDEDTQHREFPAFPASSTIPVDITNTIHHYSGVHLTLPCNGICLVRGKSGIGKTTLLKEYLPLIFDSYIYISQKPLEGNSMSTVATALGIWNDIITVFERSTKQEKSLFSNHCGDKGACTACTGKGFLDYSFGSETHIRLTCDKCGGTGYNEKTLKYHVNGKTIIDICEMTISEGIPFFDSVNKRISKVLHDAVSVKLGHLLIGQATASLSGGENIRMKLLTAAKTKATIIGIDEPLKGLNESEKYDVLCFLESIRKKGKTIVVADHYEASKSFFSKVITLHNDNGFLVET